MAEHEAITQKTTFETASATPIYLLTLALDDETTGDIEAWINGNDQAGAAFGYHISGHFKRTSGGNAALVGAPDVLSSGDGIGLAAPPTFDVSGASIRLKFTGKAATSIKGAARRMIHLYTL